jgi:hypothetical protein
VRYVIEKSVRKQGARLISTETNAHIWTTSFDQNIKDLGLGREAIGTRLRTGLGIGALDVKNARSVRERPGDPDVFDLLLRAPADYFKLWRPGAGKRDVDTFRAGVSVPLHNLAAVVYRRAPRNSKDCRFRSSL